MRFYSTNFGYQLGLIGFTRLSNIIRLTHYVAGIHPRYILRLFLVITTSLITLPLRLLEQIVYGKTIKETKLQTDPIFIIGHWRSGTTYLHNLMTQDPNYGYVSMYQAVVPDCSIVGKAWLKQILSHILPLKRPMDNVLWPLDGPQEDEVPLSKMMPTGFYTQFLFPKKAKHLFCQYVLLEDSDNRAKQEFLQKYQRVLNVATIKSGGKPLILKNPVNTARVRLLLELFPNAKFIHIHRSPYDVYKSASNLHRTLSVLTTLQTIEPERADETVLVLYELMMKRYLEDRSLIPSGQLVEVGYKELEQNPMTVLRQIYDGLNLQNFETVKPVFQSFLQTQKPYQKNQHQISPEAKSKVEQRWNFAFSAFDYPIQSPIQA